MQDSKTKSNGVKARGGHHVSRGVGIPNGLRRTLDQVTRSVCRMVVQAPRHTTGETLRVVPMRDYVKLSFMTMGGMYLTNWSLRYLSYPLRVVFKSCKLVPVMLLSYCYMGKKYSFAQCLSVFLLTLGVVIFTLADAKGKASFDPRGILIIMAGSFAEAMAASFEEKRLFNQLGSSPAEVVLWSSALGALWAAVADVLCGDLLPALRHSMDHPETLCFIWVAAVAGYVATNGVLVLIKHFGATVAEIVKSCRKVLTICVSFIIYGKPFTVMHLAGGFLFTASVGVDRFAAGGTSRRFASGMMVTSMCFVLLLLRSAQNPTLYSIVIDAGHSGTRLNLFRFDAWTLRLLDIGGAAQVHVEDAVGIANYTGNASVLLAALEPLLRQARDIVPMVQRADTPLTIRANAALSLLPDEQSTALLDSVRRCAEPYGFKDRRSPPPFSRHALTRVARQASANDDVSLCHRGSLIVAWACYCDETV